MSEQAAAIESEQSEQVGFAMNEHERAGSGDGRVAERWSAEIDGLQIRASAPGPVPAGGAVSLSLQFRNTGADLRQIYLLRSEPFRAMQSTLYLDAGAKGPPRSQPEPRPHGYVVTEADFHAIDPDATVGFTQTLRIPSDWSPGVRSVRWVCRNKVERWKGGVQTLDGPTRELFGGERIPGIWTGTLEYRFEVVVGS
ncbi:MAG: hypothetical protein AAGF11_34650 [Myxococcota bacterium]